MRPECVESRVCAVRDRGSRSSRRTSPVPEAVRLPYGLAPGQRIVLLTVFRKTTMREATEVERAQQA